MCIFVARGTFNKSRHCNKRSTGQCRGFQLGLGTQDTNVRACMLRMRLTNNILFFCRDPAFPPFWRDNMRNAPNSEIQVESANRQPIATTKIVKKRRG